MKLLVTGGAGFIGSNFIDLALNGKLGLDFEKIVVLDKLTYAANLEFVENVKSNPSIEFIEGDISNDSLLEKIFPNIDIVVNFAAESHVDRSISNSKNFVLSNILGTERLLAASLRFGVSRFVQISTDEVYGSISIGLATEISSLECNSPYSASKASADLLAMSYFKTHGLDVVITRCSNNYGSRQNSEKFIPTIIENASRGTVIPIYGNGLNSREWIHVEDHCMAISAVIKNGVTSNIYNIGTGLILSNLELARKILLLMGIDSDLLVFVEDRKGHDFRYALNSAKIRDTLGWKPKIDLDDGLKETISYYLRNNLQKR